MHLLEGAFIREDALTRKVAFIRRNMVPGEGDMEVEGHGDGGVAQVSDERVVAGGADGPHRGRFPVQLDHAHVLGLVVRQETRHYLQPQWASMSVSPFLMGIKWG